MPDRVLKSVVEGAQLAADAKQHLKNADAAGARDLAESAISKALVVESAGGYEIACDASQTLALGYSFEDRLDEALVAAVRAQHFARYGHLRARRNVQAELTFLQVLEMRRDLNAVMDRLAIVGKELADDDPQLALRAWSRRIACAVWNADPIQAERSISEGARLLTAGSVDGDAIGSFWIWQAQTDMRRGRLDAADELLHEALELREATPRRAITDLFAGAYLELARGQIDEGLELVGTFLERSSTLDLRYYRRIALSQLAPLLG